MGGYRTRKKWTYEIFPSRFLDDSGGALYMVARLYLNYFINSWSNRVISVIKNALFKFIFHIMSMPQESVTMSENRHSPFKLWYGSKQLLVLCEALKKLK